MMISVQQINTTDKAKKKIQTIAKNNLLDFELVYAIISFHWNYDGAEGTWVRDVKQDAEYKKRYQFIIDKLKIAAINLDKTRVVENIFHKLQTIDTNGLNNNFIYGAANKNYCRVSEYASYHYLANATIESLHTLDCHSIDLNAEKIINYIFLKIFRGGAVDRYNLKYVYADLLIDLPYQNVTVKKENWTKDFISKVDQNRATMNLTDLITTLKEFCSGDKNFLRTVLESLSYSGVLKVDGYPIKDLFIPGDRNKLSSHFYANEWTFPLRFWNQYQIK